MSTDRPGFRNGQPNLPEGWRIENVCVDQGTGYGDDRYAFALYHWETFKIARRIKQGWFRRRLVIESEASDWVRRRAADSFSSRHEQRLELSEYAWITQRMMDRDAALKMETKEVDHADGH